MKILLLGENGQLGGDLVEVLSSKSNNITLRSCSRKDIDVSDISVLKKKLTDTEFDILINCTSAHKTDEIELEPSLAFYINVRAVKVMAECTQLKGGRFFHISTDYVFGGEIYDKPIDERQPKSPINIYGASKSLGEQLALSFCKDTTILRVASLFGIRGSSGKGGNFLETMIRLANEKRELKVVDDQVMSPTFTYDVAQAITKMILGELNNGIYHLVNSGQASWYGLAKYTLQKLNLGSNLISCSSSEFPSAAIRPHYSVLQNSKLTEVIGDLPHWTDAVDRYLKLKGYL